MSILVSFEGGEGSGKSAQVDILSGKLRAQGVQTLLVREPGSTPLGQYLRRWLKSEASGQEAISPIAELFLFAAARADVVSKVIAPALRREGMVIVTDRFADSTTAYQGYGRRLPLPQVHAANAFAVQGVVPDLTFLLDCTPELGLSRIGQLQIRLPLGLGDEPVGTRMDGEGTRRFEQESLDFHRRVRAGYLEMAQADTDRWEVVDATMPVESVAEAVWHRIERELPRLQRTSNDSGVLLERPTDSQQAS